MKVRSILNQTNWVLSGGSFRLKYGWLFALGVFSKGPIWKTILEMALHKDVFYMLKSVLLGLDIV